MPTYTIDIRLNNDDATNRVPVGVYTPLKTLGVAASLHSIAWSQAPNPAEVKWQEPVIGSFKGPLSAPSGPLSPSWSLAPTPLDGMFWELTSLPSGTDVKG